MEALAHRARTARGARTLERPDVEMKAMRVRTIYAPKRMGVLVGVVRSRRRMGLNQQSKEAIRRPALPAAKLARTEPMERTESLGKTEHRELKGRSTEESGCLEAQVRLGRQASQERAAAEAAEALSWEATASEAAAEAAEPVAAAAKVALAVSREARPLACSSWTVNSSF